MNAQTFFKGLFMTLIAVSVTFFSQSPINWPLLAVTAIATILAYAGKNLIAVLHSVSEPGQFSFVNFISALLVAIATGITESIALFIVEGKIIWLVLGKVVLGVTFTYIGSTLFSPAKSKAKKLFV